MKILFVQSKTLALLAVIFPLLAIFVYVALRSGPLAPVPVTITAVEEHSLTPGLFGIGTVEARYTYKIGPTFTGRIKQLDVHVGDQIKAGQLLGVMDPIDLNERILAQEAALKRANALKKDTQLRLSYAQTETERYERLLASRATSEEKLARKKHELSLAETGLSIADEEISRIHADLQALLEQRNNLKLLAPADGLIVARDADPGTTVLAGQAVVKMIDQKNLWINVRFDQIHARDLAADLPAQIKLRSLSGESLSGRVLRVEPLADAVTEEVLAKVAFNNLPDTLPPLGELAEVTVNLPTLPVAPVVLNGAIHHINGRLGVWQVMGDKLQFTPVVLGSSDLEGYVQIREGLKVGNQVVTYSANALRANSRIKIVDHIPGW